jgi:endonuclease/exonuclease/phosphatase (EEP) superfamily protein YafD
LDLVFPALVLALGAVTLVSLFGRNRWPIELIQHFRPHLILASGALAALALLLGIRWEWAAITFGLALVNYAALPAPRWTRPDSAAASQPGLTVVWANVWAKKPALERTLDWAKAQKADLILIAEYPRGMEPADAMKDDYPHRVAGPPQPAGQTYSTRVVVLSRVPLAGATVQPGPGPHERSFVTFQVAVGEAMLNVVAIHPTAPNSAKLLAERDRQIDMLAGHAREPFLIAGDFNATPWSPAFAKIPGRRIGSYLFKPTWLSGLPMLGLPIDHMTTSHDVRTSAYVVGPSLGSDHRAVLARVHLPMK